LSEGGEWGKERLTEALSEIGERELPAIPALSALRLGMRCGGWRNFAGWLAGLLAAWKPLAWEKELQAVLRLASREFRLHGRADFLGEGPPGRLLILDFKRKKIPSGSRIKSLDSPQLPFYSLCRSLSGGEVTHLGYSSFLGRRAGYLEIEEEGLAKALNEAIARSVGEIEELKGFPIRPGEETCLYCPYPGICRMERRER
ncbi:MAG: PD-(D/E)XK nuclease family protein, partial [Candidatus Aureabacteria bacterium]|nr:PD-(D/E)XK nuclease family protein [Candidatus Auribacterota bacterium]